MFELLSLLQLQQLWWIIVSLLGGVFAFLLFVQGGQTLLFSLPANETEKTMLVNSLGRKWELGFTTLVLFGGALFAAFPLFYATSFGGAYWVWLAILFCFIIQAVSYEYRKRPDNFLGTKTYERFLYLNGSLGVLLLGIAISTFFSGAEFHLDENRFVFWDNPLRGLEALWNPFNYLLAFTLFFLSRIGAGLYFINNIDQEALHVKIKTMLRSHTLLFLLFFVSFMGWILTKEGFAYDPLTKAVMIVPYHYANNFAQMPFVLALFGLGVCLVVFGVSRALFSTSKTSIKPFGVGVIFTVTALFLTVGLNYTVFYPSLSDLQSSLHIENASGSFYTLTTMSYLGLMIPFVVAYIAYAWYAMNRVKITEAEMNDSIQHHY